MTDYYDSADLKNFAEISADAPELAETFLVYYSAVFACTAGSGFT